MYWPYECAMKIVIEHRIYYTTCRPECESSSLQMSGIYQTHEHRQVQIGCHTSGLWNSQRNIKGCHDTVQAHICYGKIT